MVNHAIGEVLSEAKDQNRKLDQSVFEMGYSRQPTVAQWLEQKKMQKQRELQEDVIQWDRCVVGGGGCGGQKGCVEGGEVWGRREVWGGQESRGGEGRVGGEERAVVRGVGEFMNVGARMGW